MWFERNIIKLITEYRSSAFSAFLNKLDNDLFIPFPAIGENVTNSKRELKGFQNILSLKMILTAINLQFITKINIFVAQMKYFQS